MKKYFTTYSAKALEAGLTVKKKAQTLGKESNIRFSHEVNLVG